VKIAWGIHVELPDLFARAQFADADAQQANLAFVAEPYPLRAERLCAAVGSAEIQRPFGT